MASASLPSATPGAKMLYLIRRRAGVSRDQLIVHWFAHHMPRVISAQAQAAARRRPHAWRYLATLFEPIVEASEVSWDGVAQLWFDRPLPRPAAPFGVPPRDSFQERAEPYLPWATVEYVLVDGSEHLPVVPLTLDAAFPTTRSGFHKITCLAVARAGVDFEALYRCWLTEHAADVARVLHRAGGFRYVVSLSLEPAAEPYVAMSELYFTAADGFTRLQAEADFGALDRWLQPERSLVFRSTTELIGIP